jgi:phosphoglycolate phosphatase-like HAD superfamily hydrolase
MIWRRPGLALDAFPLDAAIFDVDGVLIDTSQSYVRSVMSASEHLVRVVNGMREAPSPLLSPDDIQLFKLAGGWNNDWDCTALFTALWTARLREWRGRLEADVSLAEWARLATVAAGAGQGGLRWLSEIAPASAIPDLDVARWAHDEYYWGATLVRELYGHKPQYAPDAPGFVHNERLLLDSATIWALRQRGISRFGLITGRVGPEVNWASRAIAQAWSEDDDPPRYESAYGRSPFGAIIAATEYVKPDPAALVAALDRLGAHGALFVGDTADDLDLTLRYQREVEGALPVLAVCVAEGAAAETFIARGADIVLSSVAELPASLSLVNG